MGLVQRPSTEKIQHPESCSMHEAQGTYDEAGVSLDDQFA